MKKPMGTLGVVFLGLGMVSSGCTGTNEPVKLTKAEQVEIKKVTTLASCIILKQGQKMMEALSGALTSKNENPEEFMQGFVNLEEFAQVAVDECGKKGNYSLEQANSFMDALTQKYGGEEKLKIVIENTFGKGEVSKMLDTSPQPQ